MATSSRRFSRRFPRRDEPFEAAGTLALYVDITERERLKRERDRLKEFSDIVSHDLRNPLNVASGRLELARGDPDSEHFDAIEAAHDRMAALIGNLLALARSGMRPEDVESIELAGIAETHWRNVDTGTATLEATADVTLEADRSQLGQLLENLFRNSVEHGGDGVTVAVGALTDGEGFFVADDGSGIPPDIRSDIFESGYSTADRGTGLGLAIVGRIAAAHGWTVEAPKAKPAAHGSRSAGSAPRGTGPRERVSPSDPLTHQPAPDDVGVLVPGRGVDDDDGVVGVEGAVFGEVPRAGRGGSTGDRDFETLVLSDGGRAVEQVLIVDRHPGSTACANRLRGGQSPRWVGDLEGPDDGVRVLPRFGVAPGFEGFDDGRTAVRLCGVQCRCPIDDPGRPEFAGPLPETGDRRAVADRCDDGVRSRPPEGLRDLEIDRASVPSWRNGESKGAAGNHASSSAAGMDSRSSS